MQGGDESIAGLIPAWGSMEHLPFLFLFCVPGLLVLLGYLRRIQRLKNELAELRFQRQLREQEEKRKTQGQDR